LGLQNEDLEDILDGCRKDSVRHKEALYKGYYGYVKGVVIRYVNDHQVAEELTDDSFIKVFNNISNFNHNGQSANISLSFKSWTAKIASRTAIDFLRKKKIDFYTDEVNDRQIPISQNGQTSLQEAKDIMKLLNHLPDTQKTVFNLYEIEGFSHEEIAGFLAIPVNVCRVYLSRAKNRLKNLYEKNI
jgi:RNA polymerase sigma factor (sigma-70 family)